MLPVHSGIYFNDRYQATNLLLLFFCLVLFPCLAACLLHVRRCLLAPCLTSDCSVEHEKWQSAFSCASVEFVAVPEAWKAVQDGKHVLRSHAALSLHGSHAAAIRHAFRALKMANPEFDFKEACSCQLCKSLCTCLPNALLSCTLRVPMKPC